jgi:hypothetical protein
MRYWIIVAVYYIATIVSMGIWYLLVDFLFKRKKNALLHFVRVMKIVLIALGALFLLEIEFRITYYAFLHCSTSLIGFLAIGIFIFLDTGIFVMFTDLNLYLHFKGCLEED